MTLNYFKYVRHSGDLGALRLQKARDGMELPHGEGVEQGQRTRMYLGECDLPETGKRGFICQRDRGQETTCQTDNLPRMKNEGDGPRRQGRGQNEDGNGPQGPVAVTDSHTLRNKHFPLKRS